MVKVGDLVWWLQGNCEIPGLVIAVKPAREIAVVDTAITNFGKVAFVLLQELDNVPEWFHECELEKIEHM